MKTAILLATAFLIGSTEPSDDFRRLDKNKDGKLTKDEVPDPHFIIDSDKDGSISVEEDQEFVHGRRAKPVSGHGSGGYAWAACSTDHKPTYERRLAHGEGWGRLSAHRAHGRSPGATLVVATDVRTAAAVLIGPAHPMKILFLHGWQSVPGGVKPTYLAQHGHTVCNPKLPDDDFQKALEIAQAEFDKHQPQAVVGSSRGGAVAMNIDIGQARLVLLCPAWKKWGTAQTVPETTIILHSRADDVIPFADSEELAKNSGCALIEVGNDHRLADPEPLEVMLTACEKPRCNDLWRQK